MMRGNLLFTYVFAKKKICREHYFLHLVWKCAQKKTKIVCNWNHEYAVDQMSFCKFLHFSVSLMNNWSYPLWTQTTFCMYKTLTLVRFVLDINDIISYSVYVVRTKTKFQHTKVKECRHHKNCLENNTAV